MVYTLQDVSIIDFKVDHEELFKNLQLDLNSNAIVLSSTIEDALMNTMPVYFKNYSYGGIASIDFRGTGAERTQVFWNGMPINSPTLGSFDFSLLPAFFINDAKVRFGAASLVDGGGGIGGSIQLNQNTDISKDQLLFTSGIGSFENYSGAIKARFKQNKLSSDTRVFYQQARNNFSYSNTSKKDHPQEERVGNELWRYALQQSLNFTLDPSSSLEFNALFSSIDRNIPSAISSQTAGATQLDQLFFAQFAFNKVLKKDMFLKLRSSYQNQINNYTNAYTEASNSVNGWNNKIDWGTSFSNKIKVNASLRYDLFQVNTQGTGVVIEQQYSLLVASDIAINKYLSSSLGLRTEGRDDKLSPSMPYLGLILRLGPKMGMIKGNVSRVFRFPTMNERYWQPGGNPDLLPEEGWNYELTYKFERLNKQLNWSIQLTAFYGKINDWILWYPSATNLSLWQAQNLWQVDNKGLEFVSSMDWKISTPWNMSLKLFYSYNATTISKDLSNDHSLEGKQLILVPQHLMYIPLNLSYQAISFGVDYRFTGIRYTDRQNSNYLDAYQLIDLNLNYSFYQHKLDLGMNLNNILNQSYETYPGQPMPGINFNVQVTWKII